MSAKAVSLANTSGKRRKLPAGQLFKVPGAAEPKAKRAKPAQVWECHLCGESSKDMDTEQLPKYLNIWTQPPVCPGNRPKLYLTKICFVWMFGLLMLPKNPESC
eukprot:4542389-Amphidinium_carterae.2